MRIRVDYPSGQTAEFDISNYDPAKATLLFAALSTIRTKCVLEWGRPELAAPPDRYSPTSQHIDSEADSLRDRMLGIDDE